MDVYGADKDDIDYACQMRFVTFHYMTYQGIDSEKVIKDHGVGWVDLANSFCDPVIMAANYDEYIDQAVYAEELGFDGVAVNEHHQTPFGSMPAPNIIAAVLTQRTSRVRVCVFGNALPLRATPLSSLEEYSMLDLLSKGRLEAGFVVGGGPEYYSFALNPTDAREKFSEALDLVRRAWSEPGPFRWDGKHYQFDSVNLWPIPYQQPHPPIWLCGVGSPSTLEMCARENLGYLGVNVNTGPADFAKHCQIFRDSATKHGHTPDPGKIGFLCGIHVAEDDKSAEEEFFEYFPHGHNLARGFGGPGKTFFPPNYMPAAGLAAYERSVREALDSPQPIQQGMNLIGSPEKVARELIARVKDCHVGNAVISFQWGNMPADVCKRSMRLFAEEVMPIVRDEADRFLDDLYPQRTRPTNATVAWTGIQ